MPAQAPVRELEQKVSYKLGGWPDAARAEADAREACRMLEGGGILYFDSTPFDFPEEDRKFLLNVRQSSAKFHKNIAYRPSTDRVTGVDPELKDREKLHGILRNFSRNSIAFMQDFLRPYKDHWVIDYASFRPLQEMGREVRQSARNDLLHVDNFPTRPTNGKRILRVFVNINPEEKRNWITGGPFHEIVPQYKDDLGVDELVAKATSAGHSIKYGVAKAISSLGIKATARPSYDEIMINMYHHMKASEKLQTGCARDEWHFPPGSCWMVYTDSVPHAVRSGQYMLEQTFMVGLEGMVEPDWAPVNVLEKLAGRRLRA